MNNINVTPNQTLKDFSYGRKFVKGFASRSIAPVMLLEAFVEGGRTYQAYKRGGFTEARERLTEEMIGAAFWFSGVPLFDKLIDKYIGERVYKLPETDFQTGEDALRKPFKNYMKKFGEKLGFLVDKNCKETLTAAEKLEKAEKVIARYKFGKVMASIILANCLVGLVLPKVNQGITKYIMRKKPQLADTPENKQNFDTAKKYAMNDFLNGKNDNDKKEVSFGAIAPQTLMSLAYNFENNPKYGLISTDLGVWIGRGACARNNYERTEVLFRDISSSYFYMFNMPVIAMLLNKLQDGNSKRLDPVAAKQVTDHMQEVLKANGGAMTSESFREVVLGNKNNHYMITPKLAKDLADNKDVLYLDKFLQHLKEIVPQSDYAKYEKSAIGMSELQPKIEGKAVISKHQISDVFEGGAVKMPEFLKNVFRCSTSDQNLFTGKIKEPVFDKELHFISKETFIRKQREIEDYVNAVLKKAKGKDITADLLKKVCRENYLKNAFNWGLGFAVSAAFLSTFIPKIQYWITRKATGSNEFPGTADYGNKSK